MSSGRPIEAMICVREIESAKSIGVKTSNTSNTITGAKLQTNFEVRDSNTVSGLKEIIKGDCKRRSFTERKTLSHVKAGRMVDSRVHDGHGRCCPGPECNLYGRNEERQRAVVQHAMCRNHHRDEQAARRRIFGNKYYRKLQLAPSFELKGGKKDVSCILFLPNLKASDTPIQESPTYTFCPPSCEVLPLILWNM